MPRIVEAVRGREPADVAERLGPPPERFAGPNFFVGTSGFEPPTPTVSNGSGLCPASLASHLSKSLSLGAESTTSSPSTLQGSPDVVVRPSRIAEDGPLPLEEQPGLVEDGVVGTAHRRPARSLIRLLGEFPCEDEVRRPVEHQTYSSAMLSRPSARGRASSHHSSSSCASFSRAAGTGRGVWM